MAADSIVIEKFELNMSRFPCTVVRAVKYLFTTSKRGAVNICLPLADKTYRFFIAQAVHSQIHDVEACCQSQASAC